MFNLKCNKLLLSKALSLGIILGATVVKIPQVVKIVNSRSVLGLSALSYLLESLVSTVATLYNFRHSNPFSTYGESLFLAVQNVVILCLIFALNKQWTKWTLFTIFYAAFVYYFVASSFRSVKSSLNLMQTATIPVLVLSRLPQIYEIYKNGHTGQLSSISIFLIAAGSLARVFTSLQELNDKVLIVGAISAAAVNSILALQMVYYWNEKPKTE